MQTHSTSSNQQLLQNPGNVLETIQRKYGRKSVYLTGKITGLWYPYVLIKFGLYDLYLTLRGYRVWNPIKYIDKNAPYDEVLMVQLANLSKYDHVCFMYDWLWSDEASIVFNEAVFRKKKLVGCGIYTRKFFQFLCERE
jgi:hypothetical protein